MNSCTLAPTHHIAWRCFRPGVLLSGGLDSSLVAAIAARKIKREGSVWGKALHSFCVGLPGSPDLKVCVCGGGGEQAGVRAGRGAWAGVF